MPNRTSNLKMSIPKTIKTAFICDIGFVIGVCDIYRNCCFSVVRFDIIVYKCVITNNFIQQLNKQEVNIKRLIIIPNKATAQRK